jgi:hypothetical protein
VSAQGFPNRMNSERQAHGLAGGGLGRFRSLRQNRIADGQTVLF